MNRERFLKDRKPEWRQLESLLTRMTGQRMSKWSGSDITELARLYRATCYDLSVVQSREWGLTLERYLNDLVAKGHNCLYQAPPRSIQTMIDFALTGFPVLLRKRAAFFWLAFTIFTIPFVLSIVICAVDPSVAVRLAGSESLEMAEQSYSKNLYNAIDEKYTSQRAAMVGFYVFNNIGIAFRCFALGITFGIGTVVTLLFNGLVLGAVTGFLISADCSSNFFSFVISHGSFELTAIVVAAAAGLLMGWGMIHPGQQSRLQSLKDHALEAVQLATGAGIMLALAAVIEAYFSPLPISKAYKYAVGTALWLMVIGWLGFAGRSRQARHAEASS